MVLTDSHCHLAMLEESRASEVLMRARSAGVRGFVVPGTQAEDSELASKLPEREEGVWAAVGFHPHEAKDCDDQAFSRIQKLADVSGVVAIGEIGLDYHYMHSEKEVQRDVFVRHLQLARTRSLPVIIHNRESSEDLLELLESEQARGVRGVLHSFTESFEIAKRLLDLGFYISFSGILTFRNAEALRSTASRIPPERVLIETDTPFLSPIPHRGKENEPAFVSHIAKQLSSLWSVDIDRVCEQTTANFEKLFGVTITR